MKDVKHGTVKGYWFHVLDNQDPCPDCWRVWAESHTDPPGTKYEPERKRVVTEVLNPRPYKNNP
jgi:hypothetical protein